MDLAGFGLIAASEVGQHGPVVISSVSVGEMRVEGIKYANTL